MGRSRLSVGLAIVLVGVLHGCGRVPQTHYFVLEPQDVAAGISAGESGLTIGVEPFQVDPPYDQDRMVYRVGAGSAEIGFYAYNRWAAPLSRMLPRVVAAELGGIEGVRTIEPSAPGRSYAASMRGRVLAFEEIDTSDGQRIRIGLELSLVDGDGGELWSETLAREAAVSSASIGDVVERMRTALVEGLTEARPRLVRAIRESHTGR